MFREDSFAVGVFSLSQTVTVQPGVGYFATVGVTNGAGSSEVNTSDVISPQGGEFQNV